MKIAMATPYFQPHTGGTEKYVKDLALQLLQHGHEVTVFATNVPKSAKAPSAGPREPEVGDRVKNRMRRGPGC